MDHKVTLRDSIEKEFRERIVKSARDERETMINVLTDKVNRFLTLDVKDSNKYCEAVSEVIDDSVAYIHDWNPNKAACAFLSLMRYILNLLDQPYKETFWTLKIYSGYYYLKVHQHLKDADRILLLVGYRMMDNKLHDTLKLSLSDLVDVDRQIKIACDCLVASSECAIIATIWNSLKPLKYTFTDILTCRKSHPGSTEGSIKWIKVTIPRPKSSVEDIAEEQKTRTSPTIADKRTKSAPLKVRTGSLGNYTTTSYARTQATGTVFSGNLNQSGNQSPRESPSGDISQPRNKHSPPENLIEGTDEDHMQASLIAMKHKPVRAPARSASVGQADQLFRKVLDTKEISEDVILGDTRSPRDSISSGIDVTTVKSRLRSGSSCATVSQRPGTYGPSSLPVGEVYSYSGPVHKPRQQLGTAQEVSIEENQNLANLKLKPVVSTHSSTRHTSSSSFKGLSGQAAGVSDVYGTFAGKASSAREKPLSRSSSGNVYSGTHVTIPLKSNTLPQTSTYSGYPSMYHEASSARNRRREDSKSPEQPASLPLLRSGSLPSWKCEHCTTENSYDVNICNVCHKSKSFTVEEETSNKWECAQCTYKNSLRSKECLMCKASSVKARKRDTPGTAV